MLRFLATRDHGALFAGLSLDGAVLKQDKDDNQKLYGREVSAKELLIDGTVSAPRAARGLDSTLTKHSPKGGQSFKRV
jgi:lipid-binding SYLF domain-containing protein